MKKITNPDQIEIGKKCIWIGGIMGRMEGIIEFNPDYRFDATMEDVKAGRRGKSALSPTVVNTGLGIGFYPHLAFILETKDGSMWIEE